MTPDARLDLVLVCRPKRGRMLTYVEIAQGVRLLEECGLRVVRFRSVARRKKGPR
jgi:hypothetical protein